MEPLDVVTVFMCFMGLSIILSVCWNGGPTKNSRPSDVVCRVLAGASIAIMMFIWWAK